MSDQGGTSSAGQQGDMDLWAELRKLQQRASNLKYRLRPGSPANAKLQAVETDLQRIEKQLKDRSGLPPNYGVAQASSDSAEPSGQYQPSKGRSGGRGSSSEQSANITPEERKRLLAELGALSEHLDNLEKTAGQSEVLAERLESYFSRWAFVLHLISRTEGSVPYRAVDEISQLESIINNIRDQIAALQSKVLSTTDENARQKLIGLLSTYIERWSFLEDLLSELGVYAPETVSGEISDLKGRMRRLEGQINSFQIETDQPSGQTKKQDRAEGQESLVRLLSQNRERLDSLEQQMARMGVQIAPEFAGQFEVARQEISELENQLEPSEVDVPRYELLETAGTVTIEYQGDQLDLYSFGLFQIGFQRIVDKVVFRLLSQKGIISSSWAESDYEFAQVPEIYQGIVRAEIQSIQMGSIIQEIVFYISSTFFNEQTAIAILQNLAASVIWAIGANSIKGIRSSTPKNTPPPILVPPEKQDPLGIQEELLPFMKEIERINKRVRIRIYRDHNQTEYEVEIEPLAVVASRKRSRSERGLYRKI